jgi:hypothetical protein
MADTIVSHAAHIAVYWDFENIHASACNLSLGGDWYRNNRWSKQPAIVDIDSVMEYVASLGNVNINKAYCNWTWFFNYNVPLQTHGIHLVQLFQRGAHGKNGADIQMAIDAIEDVMLFPHLNTVVVIGGDSDYIPIAQKVRQRGKSIIGIGVRETSNQYWIKVCNEFKFYGALTQRADVGAAPGGDVDDDELAEARELLCKAVQQLSARSGERARKAAIKPYMLRLDPSFDEHAIGYGSFNEFLRASDDLITLTKGQYDHVVSLNGDAVDHVESPPVDRDVTHPYVALLKKQKTQLPAPDVLRPGVSALFELFANGGQVGTAVDFRGRLQQKLVEMGMAVTTQDVKRVYAIVYKTFAFRKDPGTGVVSLADDVASAEDLWERVLRMLLRRILESADGEPDLPQLAQMLVGDRGAAGTIEPLVASIGA